MPRETTPELLQRFARGERSAYDVLVRRHEPVLRHFVRSHVDPALARDLSVDDLVQETHVEAIRSLSRFTYRRELAFLFWLCGIARNLIRSHARRLGRQPPTVSLTSTLEGSSTGVQLLSTLRLPELDAEDALDRERSLAVLAIAMAQLSDRRRRAIILRHVEGMDADEAGAAMGLSPGAFRVLLSRALAELSGVLEGLGSGDAR